MGKEDSQTFNKELKNIKENSLDYEDGLEKLDDLCIESVNSMIEKARINLGGYFQSVDILEINLLIQRNNLKNGKWKNLYLLLKELLMKFYNCLIKSFQSRHKIIDKSTFLNSIKTTHSSP
jgi:hypothetical protein